jgi:hypothetical protein
MDIDYHPALTANGGHPDRTPQSLYLDGRKVNAASIASWVTSGWRAARTQPLLWLTVMVASAGFATLIFVLPLLRPLAVLLAPLIVGALMVAQERLRIGKPVSTGEVVAAVVQHRNALFAIGLYSAAIMAIGYVFLVATLNLSLLASVMATGVHSLSITYGGDDGVRGALESMVITPIFIIAMASAWFAPALVMLHEVAPFDAMTASLNGVARNWPTALVYFVAMTGAVWLAPQVPLRASALVLIPLLLLSIYGGYRDLFVKP